MKRLRIVVLLHPQLRPPDDPAAFSAQQANDWRTEADVIAALRSAGHELRILGVLDRLDELQQVLRDWQPDLVVNLLEEFDGIGGNDQHVVGLLEMLRQPYTGCNPRGLMLSRDKHLARQLLQAVGVPVPRGQVYRRGEALRLPSRLPARCFVKSLADDASLGISQGSVVADLPALRRRIEMLFERQRCDVLVEDYIEGREGYVGLLGNARPRQLPAWEMHFGDLPSAGRIATRQAKWDLAYRARHGIGSGPLTNVSTAMLRRLQRHATASWRALGLSGYARVDFRLTAAGDLYALEVNANPCLAAHEDYARAAAAAGLAYPVLIRRILALGLQYPAPWRILHT